MKHGVKNIEEYYERLLIAKAKSVLCDNQTYWEELQSDDRHNEWLNSPRYEYMRRQMEIWITFLRKYRILLGQKSIVVTEVIDYDKDGRSLGKKEDLILILSNGLQEMWSLKTLKKGTTIQTYSSTYFSFILGFVFDKKNMQKFIHGTKEFTSRSIKIIEKSLMEKGYDVDFIKSVMKLRGLPNELQKLVKENPNFLTMQYEGFTNYNQQTGELHNNAWKEICKKYGNENKTVLYDLLTKIYEVEGKKMVSRAMVSQGLLGEHNTVVITTEKIIFLKHQNIDVCDVKLDFEIHNQGLRFHFSDNCGMSITTTVPLTINRNGAWNLDPNRDNHYFDIDKKKIPFGYERPVKSRQIATSTNTYINIV
jgi:hypothetical protein